MTSRLRRVKAIELTLTPQQVVVVWLRNALQGGTFAEGARHLPPYREAVANAVYKTVRDSMKGQAEPLIERAVLQARREADLLYHLAVNTNLAVIESWVQRECEYIFLLGYLSAEMHGIPTRDTAQNLRRAFLMFIEPVIILDSAIAQVVEERLTGQPVLFRDCEVKLQEQLQMAETLSKHFNPLADALGIAGINLEELRSSLQSETVRRVFIWVNLARMQMLSTFGTPEEMHAAMNRHFLIVEQNSGENSNAADEVFTQRLGNMKTHPKVGDLAIVKMFETGYKRTGDIQPARNQINTQNNNAAGAFAGQTTYQVIKANWKIHDEQEMVKRAQRELAEEAGK